MPSETMKRGVRSRKESSLWPRTRPTSLRAPQEMNSLEPETASAPMRPSTGISARPGALAGSWAGIVCVSADVIRGSLA